MNGLTRVALCRAQRRLKAAQDPDDDKMTIANAACLQAEGQSLLSLQSHIRPRAPGHEGDDAEKVLLLGFY